MFLFTAPCKVLKATVSPGRPKLLPAVAGAAMFSAAEEAAGQSSATRGTEMATGGLFNVLGLNPAMGPPSRTVARSTPI